MTKKEEAWINLEKAKENLKKEFQELPNDIKEEIKMYFRNNKESFSNLVVDTMKQVK
jgi:hypothetical protein